ncbi:MAG: glycoside hydrolase family 88 protein [Phaeodactylibacter sp.]|uniref:glycoside hydrolase family 88 protein n=1 Tax=Phaeodactylibacter sp. TaxID=1940289 RepID=UPI0032EC041F
MFKSWLVAGLLGALYACSATVPVNKGQEAAIYRKTLDQLTEKAISYLEVMPADSTAIPRALSPDGTLHKTTSRDWTSGFYAGELWMLYDYSGKGLLKEAAQAWTAFNAKEQWDTHTHDLGFKIYCSFGHGYQITADEAYKEVIVNASRTLIKRFDPKVGCIRSWDFNSDIWHFPVIVDNLMNLEMLFASSRLTGDSSFFNIANSHAQTTLVNHIRADHSSYHVIDFDPETGQQRLKDTHQGAAKESSWARGQAWNLYGFAMAYRETQAPQFLEQARGVAAYIYEHPNMPKDQVPYWDFEAPHIPNEPRDVSAAAINACGLLILAEQNPEYASQYLKWADATLASLAQERYQSETPPFLLKHSVGSIPGNFEVDVPIIYADYYYVEALLRRLAFAEKANK